MCKYCENFKNENKAPHGFKSLVRMRPIEDDKGFRMAMIRSQHHHRIENGEVVEDKSVDTPIAYVKAWEWDKAQNRAHHIAVEIRYCPFCGEKI